MQNAHIYLIILILCTTKEHWPEHKKLCREKIVDPDKQTVVDYGSKGLASKEKIANHSENVVQAAQAVFNNEVEGVLMQANVRELQILDCIVVIGK